MREFIEKILVTQDEIREHVKKLADILNEEYKNDENVVFVGVLTGAYVFAADLSRELRFTHEMDFVSASSYGAGTESSGNVKITRDLSVDIKEKHVIILDELIDTGTTLSYIKGMLSKRGAASVKICALMNKEERRVVDIHSDYPVIEIPNEFVVGYGLDYNGFYRNCKDVAVLKEYKI